MTTDEAPVRAGSNADIARRMDRMEARQDNLESKVDSLAATVGRVEVNQDNAEKLNVLRFGSLDTAVKNLTGTLDAHMKRIEGIITGEIETAQTRQGRDMVADYFSWRKEVDDDREAQAVLNGQVRLLGRLAVLLVTSNVLTIAAAIYAVIKPPI